jgi:hypothetical protein
MGGTRLWRRLLSLKVSSFNVTTAPGYPACHFFIACDVYGMYISIFLHILMYKKIRDPTFPRSRTPSHNELGFLGSG